MTSYVTRFSAFFVPAYEFIHGLWRLSRVHKVFSLLPLRDLGVLCGEIWQYVYNVLTILYISYTIFLRSRT
jgi:hypothetical protein